ncbi:MULTISPECIES: cytochrome P450 [Actinoalloteichus]|uniref:Cytochrome P450 n=1 Tax=Actinoalloteichus fjordicus TaxID=1612552 RepID=A0AAC9LDP9_9PSEU|nr:MULTISPECIES: cytochrome P450 [Actinoalloteichus]APU15747.1 cytochrome P450 [Actinoalloteichus fjordicus]APU21807.1 cytochrome P450 [Actinoalloteichus sp. GBA129-24]
MKPSRSAPIGRTPPGPPRSATLAMLRSLAGDRLGLMSSAAARYGDASKLSIGPKSLYFFNHPDHAKHVLADNSANYHKGIGLVQARRALGDGLLTSDGELWRTQRKVIQPAFQHRRITGQTGIVVDEAAKLVARLRSRAGGEPVEVLDEMTVFTLGVLGRALLDSDLGAFDAVGHSFEAVQDQAMFEMVSMSMVPTWVPLPRQRRFRRARAELHRVVDRLVTDRIATRQVDGDDVLTRLIESTRREADPEVGRRRMQDEVVTLLLAGHETTASTLGWTLHLIDRHPEVGARLRAEAVDVLGDRPPVHEDLRRLVYTTMVIEEAMRLYPPVWILPRAAQQDDEVGGYHVPAGADVLICPYTLHRHPEFWADSETFRPERFAPEQKANRSRYSYLPFGAGPRFCVGSSLGMMEAVLVIAMITRELRLTGVPGRPVVPEPMLSLRVRGGLEMAVRSEG